MDVLEAILLRDLLFMDFRTFHWRFGVPPLYWFIEYLLSTKSYSFPIILNHKYRLAEPNNKEPDLGRWWFFLKNILNVGTFQIFVNNGL